MSENPLLDDIKIFNLDPVVIDILDKERKEFCSFEICEFTFETRTKFIKLVIDIFKEVRGIKEEIAKKTDVEMIFWIIDTSGAKLLDVYSLVLNRDVEWIKKNLTLKNEVILLKAVLEVNDIPFLMRQISALIQKVNNPK